MPGPLVHRRRPRRSATRCCARATTPDDAARDIGDSAVIECVGLGGMALAAAPAVAAFFGGDAAAAAARTELMAQICAAPLGALHDHRRATTSARRSASTRGWSSSSRSRRRSPPACCTRTPARARSAPASPTSRSSRSAPRSPRWPRRSMASWTAARCGPARAPPRARRGGAGVVEFALHPGGYVRFGDAVAAASRVPRAPRGPLSLLVAGLERAPLRAGRRGARSTSGALRVGRAAHRSRVDVARAAPRAPRPPAPRRAAGAPLAARARRGAAAPPRALAPGLAALRARRRSPRPSRARRPRRRAHARRRRRARRLRRLAARATRPRRVALAAAAAARRSGSRTCAAPSAASCPSRAARLLRAIRAGDADARRGGARAGSRAGARAPALRCSGASRRPRRERDRPNFIARPYRGVSVQDVDVARAGRRCSRTCAARRVYRRTEFIVAVHGDERALVQVEREDGDGILVGVRDARLLAAPDEVAFVVDATVDTGNASQLARAARARARACHVVEGRFQHVNFIFAPAPLRDPGRRGRPAAPAEAARHGAAPCSTTTRTCRRWSSTSCRSTCASSPPRTRPGTTCSRAAAPGWTRRDASTSSTPGPPEAADWTLVGCERSRQIHAALYGARAARAGRLLPAADRRRAGRPS